MKAQMGRFGSLIPTDFPSLGSPWLLSGLASLYGRSRLASRLRVANVTISNVPGPQVPLYLAGARMEGLYPLSIVVHGVALNITVQSYRGQLCFGLIACRRAVPDVAELARQMVRAFAALQTLPAPAAAPVAAAEPAAAATAPPRPPRPVRKPQLAVVDAAPSLVAGATRQAVPKPRPRRAKAA